MAAPIGNQNAKKAKIWEQAIKRALARYSGSTIEAGLDRLADRLVKSAIEHEDDSAAAVIAEKIGDRLDGKPAQAIVGDADADPIQVQGFVKLVTPPEENT
jgi:hypothetical protein